MSETTFTPGRWNWWTSNSWRRLRSDLGGHRDVDVLVPYVSRSDGHPDLRASEDDMALIAAAPDLYAALEAMTAAAISNINAVCASGTAAEEVIAHELKLARTALSRARGETE